MRRFGVRKNDADIKHSLRQLAVSASSDFTFYRDLMRSVGIHPEEADSVETLSQLPTTTKAEIPKPRRAKYRVSSGWLPVVRSATIGEEKDGGLLRLMKRIEGT